MGIDALIDFIREARTHWQNLPYYFVRLPLVFAMAGLLIFALQKCTLG